MYGGAAGKFHANRGMQIMEMNFQTNSGICKI
ncbi:DUF6783 domain-containing protein [Robinsoniella peoriensis]